MQGDKSSEKDKVLAAETEWHQKPTDSQPPVLTDAAPADSQSVQAAASVTGADADATLTTSQVQSESPPAAPPELSERSLVGETIEQYKIVQVLGRGGMSIVYKAVHFFLSNTVAIKTMHAHLVTEPQSVMRFKQEAQAATQLDHPNIIKVSGFGITSGEAPQPYIIMDYLEGNSLSELIKQKGQLPVSNCLKIFIQICSALAHAHNKGIIHRDLKPSNIMLVEKDGNREFVKLVDFGIAKVLSQEGEQAHRLTQTGEVFGSPMYMSPEQCMGRPVDKRSDVYALGCVLYEALSGKPPHQGNSVFETFHKHITAIPACLAIPEADKALVDRLDAIVFRALEKEPAKRYQTMAQLEADLHAALETAGLTSTSFQEGLAKRRRSIIRFVSGAPRAVVIMALVLTTLCGTGVLFWWKCGWFIAAKHEFQTPPTRWLAYLPSRYNRLKKTAAERLQILDSGAAGLNMARATKDPYSPEMIKLWKDRAKVCAQLDAPAEELQAWEEVVKGYISSSSEYKSDPEYGRAAEALGDCYLNQDNVRAALPLLKDAEDLRERLGATYGAAQTPRLYLEIGYIYSRLSKFSEAEVALYLSINQLTQGVTGVRALDERQLAIAFALQGDVYKRQGKWLKADQSYKSAEEDMKKTQFKHSGNFLNEIALVRAYVNLKSGHYAEASKLFESALPYAKQKFSGQKDLRNLIDASAYSAWMSGDWLGAVMTKGQSIDVSPATATPDR
jgi:serine/threonine protein kinase